MDDLGATVSQALKSCNLRKTKTCESFGQMILISEHINSVQIFDTLQQKPLGRFTIAIVNLIASDNFSNTIISPIKWCKFITYQNNQSRSAYQFNIFHSRGPFVCLKWNNTSLPLIETIFRFTKGILQLAPFNLLQSQVDKVSDL